MSKGKKFHAKENFLIKFHVFELLQNCARYMHIWTCYLTQRDYSKKKKKNKIQRDYLNFVNKNIKEKESERDN